MVDFMILLYISDEIIGKSGGGESCLSCLSIKNYSYPSVMNGATSTEFDQLCLHLVWSPSPQIAIIETPLAVFTIHAL